MDINKSRVSVLIPAYNHEKYIQETIESIINQTYQNIELIIIDDGSKDSTWQKIQEMKDKCEKRFVRVVLETKENEGTCKTLNRLLDLAQGEYVYIIASDDRAKPQAIEKELAFLSKNSDYALVVGDNEIIDSDGNVAFWDKKRNLVYSRKQARTTTFVEYLKRHNNYFNDKDFGKYSTLYKGNYIPNGYLIRKSIFDIIGFFPQGMYLEDYWLMLQISKYAKMKYLDEVLFSYRWHANNTIKNREKMRIYENNVMHHEEEILQKIDTNAVFKDVLEVREKGVLYRKQGIPFVFQILSYKKFNIKRKVIKLFNIKIFQYEKKH